MIAILPNPISRSRFPLVFALGLIFAFVPSAMNAAHSLTIQRDATRGAKLAWSIDAIAPFAQRSIQLDYQIQQSTDLNQWEPVAENITISNPRIDSHGDLAISQGLEQQFFRAIATLSPDSNSLRRQDLTLGDFSTLHMYGTELSFTQLFLTDFTGALLSGARFFAATGELVSFDNGDLTGAEFTASNVVHSTFEYAQLTGANARFAQFSHSNFRHADLRFVDFTGADLFNCDLRDTDLRGAILLNANLRFARFQGSKIDPLNRMSPKDLLIWQIVNEGKPGATLPRADLGNANLRGGNLRNTFLRHAVLNNSDLREADLSGADLSQVHTGRVDLRGTIIDEHTILPERLQVIWEIVNTEQEPKAIRLRNLSNAILSGGHLEGFNLRQFNFSQSVMIGTNLKHADLRNAILLGAFLRGADLRFANLRGARTTNADFSGAFFEETIMPDGTIRGPQP